MVQYNPFSAEVMRDPYPIYAQLRRESPVHYIETDDWEAWALAKFEDIWNASMDNRHFSAAKGTTASHVLTKAQPVTPMLNLMDPPDHTVLRSAVRDHFTPAKVRALEPMVREIAVKSLDAARERGSMDVMADMASQVSVTVACVILGIPLEDTELLNDLVWRFFKREPGVDGMTEDGIAAMGEMFGYLIKLRHSRSQSGDSSDDVINLLDTVEIGGKKFNDEDFASHLSMFVIGGSETFPKVFANCIRWLGEHPSQRAECVADAGLLPNAFLEVLRYDMPTQFLCRTVIDDIEIRGQKLRKGQPVLFLYPSANRDEDEFENPDAFDIHRSIPRLLSFGHGTHMCIGIHAAKMEGRILLEETLSRIPEYEVDYDGAERLVTDFVQGYASLPIRF